MKIGILAGEASGDALGAGLIQALRQQHPDLQVVGVGGAAMIQAGCRSLFDMERLSVMGLIEPLCRLPELIRMRHRLYQHFLHDKPDVFIGIDAPDFNLGLEIKLRKAGIPVVHYVSPSVWAWRQKRIYKIAKAVDLMLTLLPFEAEFYRQHHVPVKFVGHPLAAAIPLVPDKAAARRSLGLDEQGTYVALLPGSRRQELKHMSEVYLQAAKLAWEQDPSLTFLTSHVNAHNDQAFRACWQRVAPDLPIHFYTQRTHEVMCAADAAVVTSGTATLETMLYKTPMIIAYRMPALTYQIARRIVKTPFIGLPNLLAGELIVPELIQHAASPEKIAELMLGYVRDHGKAQQVRDRFTSLHREMLMDSNQLSAEAVASVVLNAPRGAEKKSTMWFLSR